MADELGRVRHEMLLLHPPLQRARRLRVLEVRRVLPRIALHKDRARVQPIIVIDNVSLTEPN